MMGKSFGDPHPPIVMECEATSGITRAPRKIDLPRQNIQFFILAYDGGGLVRTISVLCIVRLILGIIIRTTLQTEEMGFAF